MRVVHLSDFHLNEDTLKDINDLITNVLVADLKNYNNDKRIDLILFSGDLIDKGGISFSKNINEAFQKFEDVIINPILVGLNLDKERFIFSPGNHDIDRDADSIDIEAGLKNNLKNMTVISKRIDDGKTEGISRILPFKEFEKRFHSQNEKNISNYQSSYVVDIQGKKIGIAAFNTAWRCYGDDDCHNIILGARQIDNARDALKDCDVKIALMHHQFDCLANFDKIIVQPWIENEYDMLFCGHVHEGSTYSRSSVSGDIFVSVSPQNSGSNKWSTDQNYVNGYSIVDYDFASGYFTVHHREYYYKTRKFIPNTKLGPNNGIEYYTINKRINGNDVSKKSDFNINEVDNIRMDFNKGEKNDVIYSNIQLLNYSTENFQIKTNEISFVFSKGINIFKKYLEEIPSHLPIYANLLKNIDNTIILMDRVYYELKADEDQNIYETIINLEHYIEEIINNSENQYKLVDELFNLVEWWITRLYKLLKKNDEIGINDIFDEIINGIKVDTQDEIIEELLEATKKKINRIIHGKSIRLSLQSRQSIIWELMVIIILPVFLNQRQIISIIPRKKISEIESEDIEFIINEVKKEYSSHLLIFKGRENEIDSVIDGLEHFKFTIIKGQKEIGKSALISKVIYQLSDKKIIDDLCPLFILFSFKQSKSIPEMVSSIIEQCNTYIINKVDISNLYEIINENKLTELGNSRETESIVLGRNQIIKAYLLESIKRVIRECGEVYIVIDSIEKIEKQSEKLKELFQDIPDSCHLLLCVGENDEYINWIIENDSTSKKVIHLDLIQRSEIPLISGLNDDDNKNRTTNDEIFIKSKGQVTYLKKIVEQSEMGVNIDASILEFVNEDETDVFDRSAELCIDNIILEETLLLISVFEPLQPISLENIQHFLSYKGISYRMPKIKNELKKLDSQISNMKFKRIKLLNYDFAKFILERFFSPKDIEEFVESLFEWLSTNYYMSVEFVSKFINHIQSSKLLSLDRFKIAIDKFINNHVELDNHSRLFEIGSLLFDELDKNVDLAIRFIEKSSEMNNSGAKTFLGYTYLKGNKVKKDIIKAEKLLTDASCLNNTRAKIILGTLLLDGTVINKNTEEGIKLIEEAATLGSKSAKLDFALRLILGKDINEDKNKGQQLLNELVEEEYLGALRIMGNRYLIGGGISRDVEKGKDLLKKCIDMRDETAKLDLARYLITNSELEVDIKEGLRLIAELVENNDIEAKKFYSEILMFGIGVDKDTEKGVSLLKELSEAGEKDSQLDYSNILIEGDYAFQDIVKGKDILEKLISEEYIDAYIYFGDLLIDGEFINKDIDGGLDLLYKASNSGSLLAKRKLASRLINGFGIPADYIKGQKLYKELISKGDISAKYQYARAILNNKDISQSDKDEAIKLLKDAAFMGYSDAKRYLGVLFLDGELVEKDINVGLEYLNESVNMNNAQAMRELGLRLLFGIDISKDPYRAEKLLRKAINHYDYLAKTILGHGIVLGEIAGCNISEGIILLEEAAKDEPNAMRILAIMLLEGTHMEQDKKRGEELLKNSVDKGDVLAKLKLSKLLLDGKFLASNIEKGREILVNLVDEGDESAIIELSGRLIDGRGFDKNVQKGLDMLDELSTNMNMEAKYEYAYRLILGESSYKNIYKGEQLLREAESNGHEDSRRFLAQCLIDEKIKEKEEKEGIKLIEKCVLANDFLAMEFLGSLLLDGIYVEKDVDRAIELFEKSIHSRTQECKVKYALRLLVGDNIAKDIDKGLILINDAIKNGSMWGKYQLARLYINGGVIKKDLDKGLKDLNMLMEDGYDKAKHLLASLYIYGDRVEKDTKKGIELFEDLVKKENIDAIIEYSELLIEGTYLPRNADKGERLLKSICQKGNMEASYLLASRHLDGDGLKKQVKSARERMLKATKTTSEAMLEYGIRLKRGNKLSKDEIRGKDYIERALKNADKGELQNFGVLAYQLGDFELATQLLYKSFEMGSMVAGTSLAYMSRRNEVKGQDNLPSILQLLERGLYNNDDTAIINLVLTIVSDDKLDDNWLKADLILTNLDKCAIAAKWWYDIAHKNDDAEGHLVLGWLSKHKKIYDPDKMHYTERFSKAIEKGYYIPSWLLEDSSSMIAQEREKQEAILKVINNNMKNVINHITDVG